MSSRNHGGASIWLLITLAAALTLGPALTRHQGAEGQEAEADSGEAATLRVGTKPIEPFVFLEDGEAPRGYSIDVWNHISSELGVETEWVEYETVNDVLDAVDAGEVDVGIAGISITPERERRLDFTHSYFDAGLQVYVAPTNATPIRSAIGSLFSWSGLLPIAGLLVLIVVISHAVWWTERSHNAAFPASYRAGVGEALWWSTVNVITGGETVVQIRRTTSRILAVMWMLIGLLVMAYVTARITSVLTVNELQSSIDSVDDLAGREVVTVEGTAAADFLDQRRLGFRGLPDLETAVEALESGDAEAIVFDAPVLAYLSTTSTSSLTPAGGIFQSDKYGIVVAEGSELLESLDEVVLSMEVDGTANDLYRTWFGSTR